MWFEQLTGFKEISANNVRNKLMIEGDSFVSKINNKRFTFGTLQIPTLKEVYLTLVGGGAFGHEEHWIIESLMRAVKKFRNTPLDIKVVSYGQSNVNLANCLKDI